MRRSPSANDLIAVGIHPTTGKPLRRSKHCHDCERAFAGQDGRLLCASNGAEIKTTYPACELWSPRAKDDRPHGLWKGTE